MLLYVKISLRYYSIKNLIIMRILTIVIALLISTVSWATSVIEPFTVVNEKTITVNFEDSQSEDIMVSIVDDYGYELHNDKIKAHSLKARKYDLKHLPYGKYTVKIESERRIIYDSFELDKNESSLIEQKIIYKPIITFTDNKCYLNLMSQDQEVNLSIFDTNYETLYSEDITKQPTIRKIFDLKELPNGSYTFSVKFRDHSFYKTIAKL